MSKQIKIKIFPDGRIQGDIQGVKGKKCTNYIRVLEEILDSRTIDSDYKPEYYEAENVETTNTVKQNVRNS